MAYPSGATVATEVFSNDSTGHARALAWVLERAPGPRLVISIEGTRSYGIGLARAAQAAGIPVIEAEQPDRKDRRGKGKSDPIDAHLAVLYALRQDSEKLPTPRADGDREALRILLCAREEFTTTSTGQTNRLKALLRDGDDSDRRLARGRFTIEALSELARRRLARNATRSQAVRHSEIRRLAVAVREAGRALKANRAQLAGIVTDLVPGLLERPGIGPVCAAQAIVSFSHAGRCRSDAAFAKLAGTSRIEASSGQTKRHRLNRGGDRALNKAIHVIANTRMRSDRATRDYVARRRAQGKSDREIRRCLKRYVTRQLFRAMTAAMTPATTSTRS
ncbi:MAG: transposase [Actinobacteria bacterium]|nr:transposase [Actinomycetota bacterium]